MTQNQIRFQELVETKQHNRRTESQTDRSQTENERHNLATETETSRHNRQDEAIRYQSNDITNAHYQRQDAENQRHNVATETETQAHNRASEQASNMSAQAQFAHADASRYAAALNASSQANALTETMRHNLALESLSSRQEDTRLLSATSQADLNRAQYDTEYYKQAQLEAQANLLSQQRETEAVKTLSTGFNLLDNLVNIGFQILND